jgi:hypothetical protein
MFSLLRMGPVYWLEMVSHRLLRYASGLLHVVLLLDSVLLAFTIGGLWWLILLAQLLVIAMALVSAKTAARFLPLALAQYYVLVTLATLIAFYHALFKGIEPVWERPEGTR